MKRKFQPLRREVLSDRVGLSTIEQVRATIEEYLPHLDTSRATFIHSDAHVTIWAAWSDLDLEICHKSSKLRSFYWEVLIRSGSRPITYRSESLVAAFFEAIDLCKAFNFDIGKLDMPQED